jgi:hypothetical protein
MDLAYCKHCWESLVEEFQKTGDLDTIGNIAVMTKSIGAESAFKMCGFQRFSDELQVILMNALLYVEHTGKEAEEN